MHGTWHSARYAGMLASVWEVAGVPTRIAVNWHTDVFIATDVCFCSVCFLQFFSENAP